MAEPAKLPKLTYSTREVASLLGVSRPTVDRMVADGHLPSVDLGSTRRTLIPALAIEELVSCPRAMPEEASPTASISPPHRSSQPRSG